MSSFFFNFHIFPSNRVTPSPTASPVKLEVTPQVFTQDFHTCG
nr:hypothetical protein NNDYNQYS_NNDYNQYS_CDS_0007 [Microvirus sp.]CAI9752249.1 hypothetical protein HGHZXEWH_HGHZXEWH_CDS_0007 [Microvirus sp.]